jgi:hypothetical protein
LLPPRKSYDVRYNFAGFSINTSPAHSPKIFIMKPPTAKNLLFILLALLTMAATFTDGEHFTSLAQLTGDFTHDPAFTGTTDSATSTDVMSSAATTTTTFTLPDWFGRLPYDLLRVLSAEPTSSGNKPTTADPGGDSTKDWNTDNECSDFVLK